MKPVDANSARVTTGTGRPPKAGTLWNSAGGTVERTSPEAVRHCSTFITSPVSTLSRYPTTPWAAGGSPVVMEVSAVAVVVGATEVIAPPAMPASVGASMSRWQSCSHPRPSTTRRTTCSA